MEQQQTIRDPKTAIRLLIVAVLCALNVSQALGSSLNEPQRAAALKVAQSTQWDEAAQRNTNTSAAPSTQAKNLSNIAHPLGIQTLTIEKREQKSRSAERAGQNLLSVYQFNYDYSRARMLVVDSTTETVMSSHNISSVHLPLNADEIEFARKLIANQAPLMSLLRAEQQRRGHVPFSDLSQLDVKASIYEPRDHQDICARQRCALLSLFDDTHTVFATEPVVNLQTLTVTTLSQH